MSEAGTTLHLTGKLVHPEAVRVSGRQAGHFTLLRGDTPAQHYPAGPRKDGVEGFVVVDLLLNEEGKVLEAQIVSESPDSQGFGLAALDTAKTFEFSNPLKKLVLMSVNVEFLP